MESKELTICTPDYTQVPAHCPGRCQGGARQLLPHRCRLLSRPGHCQVEKVDEDEGGTSTEDHDQGEATAGDLPVSEVPGLQASSCSVNKKSLQQHCLNLLPSVLCLRASQRAGPVPLLFHPASQSWSQTSHLMLPSSEPQRVLPQRNERKPSDQMKLSFLDWEVSGPAWST